MEKLFDIDSLHESQRRAKITHLSFGLILFIIVSLGAIYAIPNNPTHTKSRVVELTSTSGVSGSTVIPSNTISNLPNTTIGSANSSSSISTSAPVTNSANSTPDLSQSATATPSFNAPVSTLAAPDPSKCPGITAQESAATASLNAQAAQLRVQSQNEQNYIMNNASSNTSTEQELLQQTDQQLENIVSQITAIDETYIPQLAQNECS